MWPSQTPSAHIAQITYLIIYTLLNAAQAEQNVSPWVFLFFAILGVNEKTLLLVLNWPVFNFETSFSGFLAADVFNFHLLQ